MNPLTLFSLKNLVIGATLAVLGSAALATDVGLAVTLGEPGFYGRIVLGNAPPPRVIYTAPMVIYQQPMTVVRSPIYLRVPYGHEKHWGKHCRQYNACGQPVYFVQNDWYQQAYAPRYRTEHRNYRDRDDRYDRDDRDDRDDDHRENQGYGKDKHRKNKGHGHGHD